MQIFAEMFEDLGLGFLTMNTRGRDCIVEAAGVAGAYNYLGGSLELFGESVLDLRAMHEVAAEQSEVVAFQGHSFGCEKVLNYAGQVGDELPISLLSPGSSRVVQENYTGEPIATQLARLLSAGDIETGSMTLVPPGEYGVRQGRTEYPIPITRAALVDLLSSDAMRILDFDGGWEPSNRLGPGHVYMGTSDPYLTSSADQVSEYLAGLFSELSVLLLGGGDHHFAGLESTVVGAVASWLSVQSQYSFGSE
ncbi:hypothetical protein [Promicromonospora sp. NPDC023805]|uniref:hypothetical protein n=1 Tax=Promicromonospora sp. NPDC023805 TaxID=3154696 RepID=UPI00340DA554